MQFLAALVGVLLTLAASMVGRVLLALFMGYVVFSGFDLAITWLLDQIKANLNSMPGDVVSFLGFLWVDKAIGMVFSAYSAAMVVKMAGSTKITKLVTKSSP